MKYYTKLLQRRYFQALLMKVKESSNNSQIEIFPPVFQKCFCLGAITFELILAACTTISGKCPLFPALKVL